MGKKFLLLYAGPNYEGNREFTSSDMQKVVSCGEIGRASCRERV